eukprot:GSChrysophyteH1.ASY1.ANO1.751.1 assembled CDS
MYGASSSIFIVVFVFFLLCSLCDITSSQVYICAENCGSHDRLTGSYRMTNTRPHPWSIAEFPPNNSGFCQMGCQFFFNEFPVTTTCKRLCDFVYRYQVTVSYSDLAETAIQECRDGCDIAQQVCQPGFYCTQGRMIPCPPGRYRETIPDLSVESLNKAQICTECDPGRYRPQSKGKKPDDCRKCPVGKYADVTGSVLVSDCVRCPAGKTAEEEGMSQCKCITPDSCKLVMKQQTGMVNFFENGVDFMRETEPFIGRW